MTGRLDSMFVSGGENIQPEEIEKVALEHCEVTRFVVVPQADTEFGFRPVAFAEGHFDEEEIKSVLRVHLPAFKVPRRIFAWPASEDGGAIKPDRRLLAQMADRRDIPPSH